MADLQRPRRERLVQTGWTKLAVIAETCKPGDMENALAIANTCTVKELVKQLPDLLNGADREPRAHTIHLRLANSQYEHFKTVLVAHGAQRPKNKWGLSGKEEALMKALGQ